MPAFHVGEPVIYRIAKTSTHPGPRARNVHPAVHGDTYSYEVDKFWVVEGVQADGHLVLRTRTGKSRVVEGDSPNLRRPRWWERMLYRDRFPDASHSEAR